MKIIEKPWGKEELIEVNDKYVVKKLTMHAGHRCSLQYHNFKLETIYVISGELIIDNGKKTTKLRIGETITIKPKEIHRMSAKKIDAVYLECSTIELDDVIRIEDDYNRK